VSQGIKSRSVKASTAKNQPKKDFEKVLVKFPAQVGKNRCVRVNPQKDKIVMVIRKGVKGPTSMVFGRSTEPCNTVQIIILRENNKKIRTF